MKRTACWLTLLGLGCNKDTENPDLPDTSEDLVIEELQPDDSALAEFFSKHVTAFGVHIVATESVSDTKLLHAAHVMAQYLDNDEDGTVDSEAVVTRMQDEDALLVMAQTPDELEESGLFESDVLDQYLGQDLYGEETAPSDGFDASLEEVLHLIQNAGYSPVWPDALGSAGETELTAAMDVARGGQYDSVPSSYPAESWYHYDDQTCDYDCMAVEYFYWGLTTLLGAQADRCEEISDEWELCTAAQMGEGDVLLTELLTRDTFSLPTALPDGSYQD